ncbi:MAG TPA: hypothetical protein PLH94_10310 [Fimbriimonadaceae bacterium]|nr:hypothetical protein [Fimbriimonadaceae bacterium]
MALHAPPPITRCVPGSIDRARRNSLWTPHDQVGHETSPGGLDRSSGLGLGALALIRRRHAK